MRTRTIIAFAIALASMPAFAESPNLVAGGSFDAPDSLHNWTTQLVRSDAASEQTAFWNGTDALASPDSGSMALSGAGSIMQCIPVTAGTEYDFGARVLIHAPAQSTAPRVYGRIDFFENAQCLGGGINGLSTATIQTPGRFLAIASPVQKAPNGAHAALVSVVVSQPELVSNTTRKPMVYVDDVFFRVHGGCVPDQTTLCLAANKLRVTATYRDANGDPVAAPAIQVSHSTGYFFTDNPDVVELTAKAIDPWVLVGGLTNLKLAITVEDMSNHQQKTYLNPSGRFMEPVVDLFPGQ